MKITQINDSELEINTSGVSGLIVGAVLMVIGIAVALSPIYSTAAWWASLVGLAVIAMGGALIFTASSTHTLLRRQGASTITEKRVIGGSAKEASFEASQVHSVRLESHTEYSSSASNTSESRSGQQQRQRVSNLYVVLNDATEITIGSKRANGNGGFTINGIGLSSVSKAPLSAEAQQIADFFGVPLKTDVHDASLQDIVGAVQTAVTKPIAPTPTSTTPSAQIPVVPIPAPVVATPAVALATPLNDAPTSTPPTPTPGPSSNPTNR